LPRQGQTAFALLGVNTSETQSSIDAALTFGILWLDLCRESSAGKFLVEGLVLICSRGILVIGPRAHGEPESSGGQVAPPRV
jgi:hypothetical protein